MAEANGKHDYCEVTRYCRKCGLPYLEEVRRPTRYRCCSGGGNVVGISHIVRRRELDRRVGIRRLLESA